MNPFNKIDPRTKTIIGFFALACIPVWIWVVAPQLLKFPKDFLLDLKVLSKDDFYDEERDSFAGAQYSKTIFRYETVSAEKNKLVVKNLFDARTLEGQPIFAVERLYGIDRKAGTHVSGVGDRDREGYLFAPRRLSRGESFTYWHINYDNPARMAFIEETTLYGLRVFHYESRYEGERVDQTKNLGHLPRVGTTRGIELDPHLELWIEPTTGSIVKYKDDTTAYFYDLATRKRIHPWNHFSNVVAEESVAENVERAVYAKTLSRIIEIYIPILFFLCALWAFWRTQRVNVLKAAVLAYGWHRAAAIGIISVSSIVIAGWVFGIDVLIRIIPGAAGMNPLTAICFALLGLTLLLKEAARERIRVVAGSGLMIVSALRIASWYKIFPFSVNLILFQEKIFGAHPARMSLVTALSFFLLGFALLLARNRYAKRFRLIEITAILVLIFALLSILGHLFESWHIFSYSFFAGIAIHTAVLFALASISVFSLFRSRSELMLSAGGNFMVFSGLFIIILIAVLMAGFMERVFRNEARSVFDAAANRMAHAIEDHMRIYINVLGGGKGLFAASKEVEREEWKSYVQSLDLKNNYPGILGVSYAVLVPDRNREKHVASVRAEGFSDYAINPPGNRAVYAPNLFIEPFDALNQKAFGYDLFYEKTRRFALEQARDSGRPTLTGRIVLVQETEADPQPGFVVVVPLYNKAASKGTVEERRAALQGYITAPFRARTFVQSVIGSEEGIALAVYDGTEVEKKQKLYNGSPKLDSSEARFQETKTLYMGERPWTLVFSSAPDFGITPFINFIPLLILAIGVIISILVTIALYFLVSSRQRAIAYADQVTKDLRTAKAKDEAILYSIGDGVFVIDVDYKIILFNLAAAKISGFSEEEVIGRNYYEVLKFVQENNESINDAFIKKTIERGEPHEMENHTNLITKDGRKIPVADSAAPIKNESGKILGGVVVFRDVTKERGLEKARVDFLSLASHQLRTPLSGTKWLIETIRRGILGKLNPKQEEYLTQIYTVNERMIQLVFDMLNALRLESGTVGIKRESISIFELYGRILTMLEPAAKKQNILLRNTFENHGGSRGLTIETDPVMLASILECFTSNAIEYSSSGQEVILGVEEKPDTVLLFVKNFGPVIPKDEQKRLFERFYRGSYAKMVKPEGSGLGLYIASMLAEKIGAKISFESDEKNGTIFYVRVPKRLQNNNEHDKIKV